MLQQMLRSLGITPERAQNIAHSGQQAAHQLICTTKELLRALQQEYGRPSCELEPFDPAVAPWAKYVQLDTDQQLTYKAQEIVRGGRYVVGGHIKNLGDERLHLVFTSPDRGVWEYVLDTGDVFDFARTPWHEVQIKPPSGEAGEFMMIAQ